MTQERRYWSIFKSKAYALKCYLIQVANSQCFLTHLSNTFLEILSSQYFSHFFSHTRGSISLSIAGSFSSFWPLNIGPLHSLISFPSTYSLGDIIKFHGHKYCLMTPPNHIFSSNLFPERQTHKFNCLLCISVSCSKHNSWFSFP